MPATPTYRPRALKALGLAALVAAGFAVHTFAQSPAVAQSANIYTREFHSFSPGNLIDPTQGKSKATAWKQSMQSAQQALSRGDYKTARVYFRESLDAGHVWAAWYLGELYRLGYGGKRNPGKAFRYYRKVALAAEDLEFTRPHYLPLAVDSLVRVADGYRAGIKSAKVNKDPSRAYRLYRSAEGYRHPGADHGLGIMFLDGIGVRKNPKRALLLLRSAARDGYTASRLILAHLYLKGRYVRQDRARALMWYELAQRTGRVRDYPALNRRLKDLHLNAKPDERGAAAAAAARWTKRQQELGAASQVSTQ